MKAIKLLLTVVAGICISCQQPRKTNRELFDESYEINVERCVEAILNQTNIDSLQAESICSCAMNNLYAIDSNFVRLPEDSMSMLLDKYSKRLEEICKDSGSDTLSRK